MNIKELRALHDAATLGEWYVNDFDDDASDCERYQIQARQPRNRDGDPVLAHFDAEHVLPREAKANATFAAAAKNHFALLLDVAEAAEAWCVADAANDDLGTHAAERNIRIALAALR